MNQLIKTVSGITLAVTLSSCTMLGPDFFRPKTTLPENYQQADATTLAEIPDQWWTLYQDPQLNALVEKTLKNNSDIKIAVARIEEADAQMREVGAAILPTVSLGGNATRNQVTETGIFPVFGPNPRNSYNLSLSSSVEIDFWGKLRRTKEAARANYLATQYAKETVQLSTASLVVTSYLNIRSLDSQLRNVKESLSFSE